MKELKPCPWCGSEARIRRGVFGLYYGICNSCASYKSGSAYDTMDEAISAWNNSAERTCKTLKEFDGCESYESEELYPCSASECSACGDLIWDVNTFNYCTNCGARVMS